MTIARCLPLLILSALTAAALAQAPHTLSPDEHARVAALVHRMTLEQKIDYIGGTGFATRPVPSLGLPALEMSDGPYGTRSNAGLPSTTYAAGIGLAASWDRELARRVGEGIGRDARARGVHFMLGPGVNIYRSPKNGRNFEYFGEDPFLAKNIALGYIEGMQKTGVSATIKHFLGNNSEYLRHDSDSLIDERALREIYLPTFETAVKTGKVGAIMDSYNLINGAHATQNGHFNTDIARKEWGFAGVMMSDWDATYDAVAAANGGLDLEMPVGKFMNRKNLLDAVKQGTVPEATIDLKIVHVLETAMSFGWLEAGYSQRDASVSLVDARNRAAALDSARESAVLLKNAGAVLPLDRNKLKTLLIVGPDAYPGVPVGGGSAGVVPFHLVSTVEGLSTALGTSVNVLYEPGLPTLAELAGATNFTRDANGGEKGVKKETFSNGDLSGAPDKVETTAHINVRGSSWATLGDSMEDVMAVFMKPPAASSHRYTGFYTAPADGSYELVTEGAGEGGGHRVSVDGKLVIDSWSLVRAFQPHVMLSLTKGPHKLVVEEMQTGPVGGHLRVALFDPKTVVTAQALALAAKADAVVIAAGYSADSESEGGDRTFALPYGQDELIAAMAKVNPKTIVTVTSGGNVDSSAWLNQVPALLETWYAGQEGGTALAEILLGTVNPSGHLPATFEARAEDNPTFPNYYPDGDTKKVTYKEGIFVGYRGYEHNHTKPLFPFGYGLSYTTFGFANLKVVPEFNSAEPHVTVMFDVKNTGTVAGAEVAQVYVSPAPGATARPAHELKGFERVMLAPGETKHVSVELDPRAFSYWDVPSKSWKIDTGTYGISVGDSVESLSLHATVESPK